MDRRPVVAALLVVLVLAALGVAATSLDVVGNEGSGAGVGSGESFGGGVEGGGGFSFGAPSEGPIADIGPTASIVVFLLFLLLAIYGLYTYWREAGLAGLTVIGIALFLAVVALVLQALQEGTMSGMPNRTETGNGSVGGGGGSIISGETVTTAPDPPLVLAALLFVTLLGVGLAFLRLGDDDLPDVDGEDVVTTDADVEAVARAAGDAADRIESGTAGENEVYRAWREMTEHLDVASPATSTPEEFAAAAVDAGMDREDVTALTRLFEETRYGDYDPTPEREERALAALRNIEARYATDDPGEDA